MNYRFCSSGIARKTAKDETAMTPVEKLQWQQHLKDQLSSGELTLGQAVQRIRTELYQMT